MVVFADLRWSWRNGSAGIGAVKDELVRRKPIEIALNGLYIPGQPAGPADPFAISWALRGKAKRGVFWSPGFMPPVCSQVPSIVTVHDLMHLHYYSRLHRQYYNLFLRRLFRRCEAIVCVSEYVRGQFIEWSGISPTRVHLIYNGVSERFVDPEGRAPFEFRYVLYAGNRRPYKNIVRLITAYAGSRLPAEGISLLLTGDRDDELLSLASRLGISSQLRFAGRVNEQDIGHLFSHAVLVALVSLSEGFGLPILEGMVSGVPVLTSNVAAMAEVGGSAALQVNPMCVDEIRIGLELLTFDTAERERRIDLGRQRAAFFSWDLAARQLWSLISNVAS